MKPLTPAAWRRRRNTILISSIALLLGISVAAIGWRETHPSAPDPAKDMNAALSFYQSPQYRNLSLADRRRFGDRLVDRLRAQSFLDMLRMMGDRFRAQKDISRFIADPVFAAFVEKFYDMPWLQRQVYLTTFALGAQAVFAAHPGMAPKPGVLQQNMAQVMSADGPRQQGYIQQFFCDLGQKRAAMGLHGGPW
jgi:hypothetical protein